jgi:hypothetical protein
MLFNKETFKTKTFWAGLAGVVMAIGGAVTGELSVGAAIQTGVASLLGICLRDAVTSTTKAE